MPFEGTDSGDEYELWACQNCGAVRTLENPLEAQNLDTIGCVVCDQPKLEKIVLQPIENK